MAGPRSRTRFRFAAKFVLAGGLVLLLARNWIAVQLLEQIGSRVLQHQVHVGQIQIGFHDIAIFELSVEDERDSVHPLLQVRQIELVLSPIQGLRHGVWAERVTVTTPVISLRFASDGSLLTRLPQPRGETASSSSVIPVRQIIVRGAGLIAHQTGREPLTIADVALDFYASNKIRVQTQIPNIFGANIDMCSTVDATTLSGETRLLIPDFHVDSGELARFALVPEALARLRISADASVAVLIQHPPNDLNPLHHRASVIASISKVDSAHAGTLLASMEIRGVHDGKRSTFTLNADTLDGTIDFQGHANLQQLPKQLHFTTRAQDCDLAKVVKHLQPSVSAGSILAWNGLGTLSLDGKNISFDSSMDVSATNTYFSTNTFDNKAHAGELAHCESATVCIQAQGTTTLDNFANVVGSVSGKANCSEIQLAPFAKFKPFSNISQLHNLGGNIAMHAEFNLPLDTAVMASESVASAHLITSDITASGVRLNDSDLALVVTGGVVRAESGELVLTQDSSGQILATAHAKAESKISSSNPLASTLLTSFGFEIRSLRELAKIAGQPTIDCEGAVTANASTDVSLDQITDVGAWYANVTLESHSVRAAGETLQDTVAQATLRDGRILVPRTQMHWRGANCSFEAHGDIREITTKGKIQLDGEFAAGRISVAEVAAVASRFSQTPLPASGIADAVGNFHLTTSPLAIVATGNTTLTDARYAGRNIGQAKLDWDFRDDALRITSQSTDLFGGRYVATASMHDMDWSRAKISAQFNDISASKVAAFLPSDAATAGKSFVAGSLSGGLEVTSVADLSRLQGTAWLDANALSIHGLPIEIQRCVLEINDGRLTTESNGIVADGTFVGTASSTIEELIAFSSAPETNPAELPVIADFHLGNVSVQRLVMASGLDRRQFPVQASADATIQRNAASRRDGSICNVVASVEDLRWNRDRLASLITATVLVEPNRVVLRSLDGQFADGRLLGSGEARISSGLDGNFEFSASRVNLRRAAAPFGGSSNRISGTGDVSIRGRLGRTISGDARIAADHVSVSGIGVPRVRIPLDWSYASDSQTARWRCRGGVVEAGNGEIRITTDGTYSRQLNMNLIAEISRVDSSRLLVGKSVGAGIIDGRVALYAKQATSPKQLSGTFDIELSQVKALEIPVLSDLPQLIDLPSLSSLASGPTNDGGTIFGRLSGSVIHIDQIALQQSNIQVLVDGTSTIDGRLDLNVTASTGSTSPTDGLVSILNSPLMLAAPAPLALIAKANDAMKDRVVHVHVGGTANRPLMKIQPAKALTQDAIRFFLSNSVGTQIADAATTSRNQNKRYTR